MPQENALSISIKEVLRIYFKHLRNEDLNEIVLMH